MAGRLQRASSGQGARCRRRTCPQPAHRAIWATSRPGRDLFRREVSSGIGPLQTNKGSRNEEVRHCRHAGGRSCSARSCSAGCPGGADSVGDGLRSAGAWSKQVSNNARLEGYRADGFGVRCAADGSGYYQCFGTFTMHAYGQKGRYGIRIDVTPNGWQTAAAPRRADDLRKLSGPLRRARALMYFFGTRFDKDRAVCDYKSMKTSTRREQ